MNYNEYYRTIFPLKLKKARILVGLKQEDVSEILGIPQSMYARYETGKTLPDVEMLMKLAKIMEVEPLDLYGTLTGKFDVQTDELGKHFSCDYIEKINAVDLMTDNSSIGQMEALWDELSNENRQAMLTFAYCLIFDQNKDENMEKSIENSKWMLNEAKDMMKLRKERQKARERYEYRKEKGLSVAEHIELYEEQWKACEECGRENCEGCKWKDIK